MPVSTCPSLSKELCPLVLPASPNASCMEPIAGTAAFPADSANADAHCAIDASEAPAQIIKSIKAQNIFVLKSSEIVMLLPSATMGSMGQVAKL